MQISWKTFTPGSEDGEDDEGQADEPNPPAALRNNLATFITPEQLANALLQAQQVIFTYYICQM